MACPGQQTTTGYGGATTRWPRRTGNASATNWPASHSTGRCLRPSWSGPATLRWPTWGAGPGMWRGWLAERGVTAVGVDLSPAMVAASRRRYPEVEFRQSDLLSLPAADGEFGTAVALYSVIHLRPAELRPAFAEMRRVLRPGGSLLVAFHVGAEVQRLTDWWGHEVDVDFHYHEVETVAGALREAGLTEEARLERAHHPQEGETQRCYLLVRRPDEGTTDVSGAVASVRR
ncbi:class I SAM-dependent methyltransferase [Micromonospora sp. DPT]|uniref:class I SAM-dependent methyltransferase n=1 Tax=Micromonospora sp. DPT TaxID=3142975 RepID=UPI00320AA06C